MIKKTILITGAFGFIGTNLSSFLKDQEIYTLIALDIEKPLNHKYDKFYSWNQIDEIDWDNIHTIIHLAGKAHDTKNSKEEVYREINVGLTKRIISYFKKSKAQRFIFFSSVKAVADTVSGAFLCEETIPNPQTPYGKSKLEAERLIQIETNGTEKKVFIIRPCMIHGPGNKGNLNLLYKMVEKGIPYPLGSFENLRSFTSIRNLNFVLEQLIQKDVKSGIYQLADDETLSTNQLIEEIAFSMGKKKKIWYINKRFVKYIATIGDFLHLPINNETLKKLTESYVVSNNKIKKTLGIDKMPISAKKGLVITLKSFKN